MSSSLLETFWILAGADFEAPLFFLATAFLLASCIDEKTKALFLLWALATTSLALWTALSDECYFWWFGMAFSETIFPQMEHGAFFPLVLLLLVVCKAFLGLVEPCTIWAGDGLLPCATLIGVMLPEKVWCSKFLLAFLAGIH